jgi:hypothetical protein
MSELSRRGFLGAAGAAGVAAVAATTIDSGDDSPPRAASGGPIVARVRDAATGEVAVYVGTREIVRKDRALAAALARAASAH